MEKKYCPGCKRKLEHRQFSRDITRTDSLSVYCRECFHFVNRLSNKRNKERALKNRRDWRLNNPDKVKKSRQKSYGKYKYDYFAFIKYLHMRMRQRIREKDSYKGLDICDKDDFFNFAVGSNNLKPLFDNWIINKYNPHLKPSVDRIDNNKGYTLDNIQFMTWMENTLKH